MSLTTKAGWIPGLLSFALSMSLYALFIRVGPEPLIYFRDWHHPLQFPVLWLLAHPVLGALAAYFSGRLGGTGKIRLLAAALPVSVLMGVMLIGFVADLIADVATGHHSVWHSLCGLGSFVVCWVLVPGAALLLGASPFLRVRGKTSCDY